MRNPVRLLALASLPAFCLLAACGSGGKDAASHEENPSTVIPEERLVEDAPAGNGAMADTSSGMTAVDPDPIGSSAPGAATVGPAAAGGATSSEGGRSLGDRSQDDAASGQSGSQQ